MRLGVFHILLASASLVTYAAASPIRVVVVSSYEEVATNVRFVDGKPVVSEIHRFSGPLPIIPTAPAPQTNQGVGRHPGCGLKNKALSVTNKFREMFGLPLIATAPHHHHQHQHEEHAPMPLPFIGLTPIAPEFNDVPTQQGAKVVHVGHPMGHRRPQFHRSFLHRVHRALMVLGPWEGRAVAFVLGCGIGVLLRMFWVMTIVVFRAFRGRRSNDEADVHDVLVFEADAEDILVPPPQYTDEKVALIATDEKKP
ncbi:hypothetical protein PHLGIDRAFT_30239 [Phlebiopsis gigantea 11061_1 CR5-6]|uniref:Uncharacterized protein n=1 Tax=Phlebiopsis gigantea (strain 11061_1 CR5-6) TaxID=745531 RepID=A0A0C3SAF6_PHLG1|nr:hypothetical protein PHLGIDRAFT_30239 [Phlebiopsis gigantea 11061_1 CR5-6]